MNVVRRHHLALLARLPRTAQSTSAEAGLRLNIVLPLNSPRRQFRQRRADREICSRGNTPGAQWPLKGKVRKDLTVEQGYHRRARPGSSCWERCGPRSAALIVSAHREGSRHGQLGRGFSDQPKVVNGFSDLMVGVQRGDRKACFLCCRHGRTSSNARSKSR